ncbi:hypothetical protein [Roseibium aggregatum]|uniref:Uncharacterized protein n=1 Tax=Roseibium aggregatum TaxID=187304 RepID=A0A939J4S6_9HYPH|nr:hypothetical protein [Roseibium aggregatum]MBN9671009.1 hypothetical protein [Roseibium aggregatum]
MAFFNSVSRVAFTCVAVLGFTMSAALADCQADIDKVERAVSNPGRAGIDETVVMQMRELLDDAVKEHRAGNESKCQELIDKAKYMGAVE